MTQMCVDNFNKDDSSSKSANLIPVTFWYHVINSNEIKRNQESSEYEPNLISIGSCDKVSLNSDLNIDG